MSLFDQVDQAINAEKAVIISTQDEHFSLKSEGSVPDPPASNSKRPQKKTPEKLKFLKPCTICQGREFTHRKNGGFFCKTCQPGIDGTQVIATGHRKPLETVDGLPCARCASTTYTREKDGYQFPDGTIIDGWHCGGGSCLVKLLTGNKDVDLETLALAAEWQTQEEEPGMKHIHEKRYFRAGFPWIMDNLDKLLTAGWSRLALFRRSKFRWPCGPWGAAWLSVWCKPDLVVRIGSRGEIVFTFPSPGRTVTHRIYLS